MCVTAVSYAVNLVFKAALRSNLYKYFDTSYTQVISCKSQKVNGRPQFLGFYKQTKITKNTTEGLTTVVFDFYTIYITLFRANCDC